MVAAKCTWLTEEGMPGMPLSGALGSGRNLGVVQELSRPQETVASPWHPHPVGPETRGPQVSPACLPFLSWNS